MKNIFLKRIGGAALAILMLVMFAQVQVTAQDNNTEEKSKEQTQEDLQKRNNKPRALEGSWNVQVTIRNCQTGAVIITLPAMNTFMRGGTMQETGGSNPSLRAPGHGVWSYQHGQNFSAAFQYFRFNADGSYAGIQRVRRQIAVSRFGSNFNASATVEIFNPNGVLVATACATETATRFE